MNRLTALGLASLLAYALLITSKYAGFVSAAREDRSAARPAAEASDERRDYVIAAKPTPAQKPIVLPQPVPRAEPARLSPAAQEFRSARDLKAYVDAMMIRRDSLTGDERYHLAKALEECQFAMSINEDLGAYAAKQRRQFLATLPLGDPANARRIAAYEAVDNTQRCMRFQGAKLSAKDVEDLYHAAAQQGDPRAQARVLVAELNKNISTANRADPAANARVPADDLSRLIGLLETHDPEAMLIVGQFLAQSAMTSQLRIGPNGEVPEPSAFLGAFSLVACDLGPDCVTLNREPQLACAYGGYCNAESFEELYQNFMASPWAYSQAIRYRSLIHTALETRNWSLIGLQPQPPVAPNAGPN